MRLKTFLSTYFLIIIILFSSLSIVSIYLNDSQMNMLREQGERDFQRISTTLARDIAILYGRYEGLGVNMAQEVNSLMVGYTRYYGAHNIALSLSDKSNISEDEGLPENTGISFVQKDDRHFVHIGADLQGDINFYRLDFYSDVTESIDNVQNIQRILLIFMIMFSIVAAFALYLILARIFKPLDIVAGTSRKIADEHYSERIYIKGNNELATVAKDFNRMAEKIEKQIYTLEAVADGKQRFIDNFAHEIRTPLTSIYGNAEYLQVASLEEGEHIQLTQSIMNKTKHMQEIANSLLQLATLRNYTPKKSEINIPTLFEEIAQTINGTIEECDVSFVFKSSIDIMVGQEDLIKSLLLNLCYNGIKACQRSNGSVSLEAKQEDSNVVLSVTDTGIGIPEESLAKITEPFYRVDKSRSPGQGIGLGLTLCKEIVDIHDAKMIFESKVGSGTTVKLIFTASR